MSTFGRFFRVTTYGESHCKGVGCVIDGCPPLVDLTEEDIQPQLTRRRPGQSRLTTPRSEKDLVTILSGTELGRTLGTPISLFVPNENVIKKDYSEMSVIPRPGHADYTYQVKYGVRATSGGGRSSARETIGRVAAGAVAEKWFHTRWGTTVVSFVSAVGPVTLSSDKVRQPSGAAWTRELVDKLGQLQICRNATPGWKQVSPDESDDDTKTKEAADAEQAGLDAADEAAFVEAAKLDEYTDVGRASALECKRPAYQDAAGVVYNRHGVVLTIGTWSEPPRLSDELINIRCPCPSTAARMATLIRVVKGDHDSIGGVVTGMATRVPVGLGEPCFDKMEAALAGAMLSLPATKGFEIGSGFEGTKLRGSQHNDTFESGSIGGGGGGGGGGDGGGDGDASEKPTLLRPRTNHAGGTLGGITSGADLEFRVAFKPVSTIGKEQDTATYAGEPAKLKARGRHDPCVLPRAPPLIEAMTSLVIADAALGQLTRSPDLSTL